MIKQILCFTTFLLLLTGCFTRANPAETLDNPDSHPSTLPQTRHWQASPVLVEISYQSGGMMMGFGPWLDTAELVVYRDGMILKKEYIKNGDRYREVLWEGHLSPPELCTFLLRIEKDGFFDFDPVDYQPLEATHQSTAHIAVNSWRQQEIHAYGLSLAVRGGYTDRVPEGLLQSYSWLGSYMPPNPVPHIPERIHVRIASQDALQGRAVPLWNVEGVSITTLLREHGTVTATGEGSAIFELEGDGIEPLWSHFAEDRQQEFMEGNVVYTVGVRPILPYESLALSASAGRDVPEFADTPVAEMDCTATDLPPFKGEILPQPTYPPIFSETPKLTATPAPNPLRLVSEFGSRHAQGQFESAGSIAISPQQEIVVGDPGNYRLQWFTAEGEFIRSTPLVVDGNPIYPSDMLFTAEGTLLVLGNFHNELYEVAEDGAVTLRREGWTGMKRSQSPYEFPDHPVQAKDGTLYVVNTIREEEEGIIILHPDGREEVWMEVAGIPFNVDGSRFNIRGLGIDNFGNLYIALRAQNRVLKVAPNGEVTPFTIQEPMSLRVLPDGSFYVIEWQTLRYYDANGKEQDQWHPGSCADGLLDEFAIGEDESVYVVNQPLLTEGVIVCRYSPDGQLLGTFGDNRVRDGQFSTHKAFSASPQGDVWLLGQDQDDWSGEWTLQHLDAAGNFLRRIEGDWDSCDSYYLAAHSDQTLFVANPCEGTITRYNAEGNLIGNWGAVGSGTGQFNLIRAMTLAPDEQSLYVVDAGNRTMMRWSLEGEFLEGWAASTMGVQIPIGVAVDSHHTFYLLDEATGEVVVYRNSQVMARWSLPTSEESVYAIAYDEKKDWLYVGGSRFYVFIYETDGTYIGQIYMNAIAGTQVDSGIPARLYASDGYAKVWLYEPSE